MISVLGGGGFIGANLVRRLVNDGHDVTAVDVAFPPFRQASLKGADTICADLTHPLAALQAVEGSDLVFHLAADMGGVGYFHSDADLGAAMRNGRITLNVLEAITAAEVPGLFYASSACAYPTELQQQAGNAPRLTEDLIGHGTPDALYGAEKLHALRLCSKVPGARVGVFHTIYGPLQEHEGRRMKFPAAVATKALAAKKTGKLELWGDGEQLRSYLHVDDAVDQILAVAFADAYEGPVNIGASGAVTCRQVAEMCLGLVGAEAEITSNPAGPSGVLARDCDLSKHRSLYGEPADRGCEQGFADFLEWLEWL